MIPFEAARTGPEKGIPMSAFIACATSQEERIRCIIAGHNDILKLKLPQAEGWGAGFYQHGELLTQTRPFEERRAPDLLELLADLEGQFLIGQLRAAPSEDIRRESFHPFLFKRWLFAHNGSIPGFDQVKDRMLESMPSFIRRSIKGPTDSEHLFHLFLSFMYDEGQLDRMDCGPAVIREALVKALSTAGLLGCEVGQKPGASSVAVSNGSELVILREGIPTFYTFVEGIENCAICRPRSFAAGKEPAPIHHPEVKAVIVVSGVEMPGKGWIELPDSSALSVSSSLAIETVELC